MIEQKKNNLLIVDDLPKNIQILGRLLASTDRNIAYALNGDDALRLLSENQFDLILLDIMMPGKNGFEVCEAIRANPTTAKIPVIFLTARSEIDSIVKGFEVGAQDYITKPFNASELSARVQTQLELVNQRKQLLDLNHNLENKVAERTAQLEQANRQLANLEKAKSEFLGIISHELRTPLNGIIGITQLLSMTSIDPEQKEYLQFLSEASKRLMRFSEIALLITSLQAKNQQVDLFTVSVKNMAEMAIDDMQSAINEKELRIDTDGIQQDLMINVDSELIQKSLSILIENAAYHLASKGKIAIRTRVENHLVYIDVCDNGKGFDPELLQQLNMFVEQDNIVAKEGLGLSLAAVKLILEAHSGHVSVANHPDGGACVSLVFEK